MKIKLFFAVALVAAMLVTAYIAGGAADAAEPVINAAAEPVAANDAPQLITLTIPRTVDPPESEAPIIAESGRYDLDLTQDDIDLIAKIVFLEAGGEPEEGQQAVAEVILNRVASEWFPDSVSDVIFEAGQFTTAAFVDQAEPTYAQYAAIEKAMTGENVLPEDVVFFATTPENSRLWGWIGGHAFCRAYIWE